MAFQKIADEIKDDEIKWNALRTALRLDGESTDDILARLKGTIGQAYIFQGCIENNESDQQLGYEEIKDSLRYLDKNSLKYRQGVNFMVTYHWLQNDLDSALVGFSLSTDKITKDNLLNINEKGSVSFPDVLGNTSNSYEFLNQLRLISLRLTIDPTLSNATRFKESLIGLYNGFLNRQESYSYPNFMLIKWVLCILKQCNMDFPEELGRTWLKGANWDSDLLGYMALPLYYMLDHAEFVKQVQSFQDAPYSEGAEIFLKHRASLIKTLTHQKENFVEANRLLPYYYS